MITHRTELRPEARPDPEEHADVEVLEETAAQLDPRQVEARLGVRTRERYAAVQRLHTKRRSITAISAELGLDRRTVRRFVRAEHVEDLLIHAGTRQSLLDAFKPYLHDRSTPDTPMLGR